MKVIFFRILSTLLILTLGSIAFSGSVQDSSQSPFQVPWRILTKPTVSLEECVLSIETAVPQLKVLQKIEGLNTQEFLAQFDDSHLQTVKSNACVANVYRVQVPSNHDRGIFLDFSHMDSLGRNCYLGSTSEASARVQASDHANLSGLQTKDHIIIGDTIRFKVQIGTQAQISAYLKPCTFEFLDLFKVKKCDVTLISTAEQDDDALIAIDKYWRSENRPARLIDCSAKTYNRVINSWQQYVTTANVKLAELLISKQRPLLTIKATSGSVRLGGSLLPYQHWSGQVGIEFLDVGLSMELCDASIVQFSRPGEVETQISGLGGRWCPWGVEVKQLRCEDTADILNEAAVIIQPLQMTEAIANYCSELDSGYPSNL